MKKSEIFLKSFLNYGVRSLKNKEYRKLFFCKFKLKALESQVFLMNLECVRPNEGYGSKFLSHLCKKADDLNMTIVLDAIPQFSQHAEDQLTNNQLMAFYEKFGFKRLSKIKIYGSHTAWRMIRKK